MTRAATARLFVAVDPPPEVGRSLVAWARAATSQLRAHGSIRVLDAATLHLTLCFLGNRPVGEIDTLCGALATCGRGGFRAVVGAPLWLPRRRPRSLAVEVHDADGELEPLQRRVTRALADVSDWRAEPRRFRAHVTVARTRGVDERLAGELRPTPPLEFDVRALALYRSHLSQEGASYEQLGEWDLGGWPA